MSIISLWYSVTGTTLYIISLQCSIALQMHSETTALCALNYYYYIDDLWLHVRTKLFIFIITWYIIDSLKTVWKIVTFHAKSVNNLLLTIEMWYWNTWDKAGMFNYIFAWWLKHIWSMSFKDYKENAHLIYIIFQLLDTWYKWYDTWFHNV